MGYPIYLGWILTNQIFLATFFNRLKVMLQTRDGQQSPVHNCGLQQYQHNNCGNKPAPETFPEGRHFIPVRRKILQDDINETRVTQGTLPDDGIGQVKKRAAPRRCRQLAECHDTRGILR